MKLLGFDLKNKTERYKFIIIFFGTLLFLVVGTGAGLKITSDSNFCSVCHAMAPEVATWKASSHSQFTCTNCHIQPGVKNLLKEKAIGVKRLYSNMTDGFLAPIQMPTLIPDESCQRCHDMSKREISTFGDIIIDHQIHEDEKIACVICHDGVAHGKVSEKRVTYKSDYAKWNEKLAERFMGDAKYIRPQMKTCMECHELRRAPLSCKTCHETSMLPEEHKTKEFITKEHMQQAKKDILYCNTCHSYTTKNQVEGLKGKTAYASYLSDKKSKGVTVTVKDYAKTNDYCKKCHGTRPQSHKTKKFMENHGSLADQNKETCFTCHDNRITGDTSVVKVSCDSCHPSSHSKQWKKTHPIPIMEKQKPEGLCFTCHSKDKCTTCHVGAR